MPTQNAGEHGSDTSTESTKRPTPKPRKKRAAIIPLPPTPPEIRLGSLAIADPKEMIHRAAELASALAEIIHKQKDQEGKPTLYVMIQGKKYVRAEGWTTLGAMMGVVPMEEFCDPLPEGGGYKAKVRLVRLNDGQQVGAASAICKLNEPGWNKDAAATHSKAITRATGKAFRLSFAWIMKLAGFEPTLADELFEIEGSEESAQEVAAEKLAQAEAKKQDRKIAKKCVFMSWPESHNGHNFFLTNRVLIMENGLHQEIVSRGGHLNERDGGYYVSSEHADDIRFIFTQKLGADRFIERKANGNNSAGTGAAPVS